MNYLLTTEGEILVDTIKIQTARVKGLPMLSEEVISDAVATGAFPDDLSDYLLKGSPPLKSTGAKKTEPARAKKARAATLEEADEEAEAKPAKRGAAAKASTAKATTAKRGAAAKAAAVVEEEEEEDEPAKPAKRTAKAASARSKKSAAMDVDEEEEEEAKPAKRTAKAASARGKKSAAAAEEEVAAEAPKEEKKEEAAKETSKRGASKATASAADEGPKLERAATTLDMTDKKSEVVFSFDTTGSMYPCLTQVRRKINEAVEKLFEEIGADNLRIGITAHGDYCDAGRTYVTKHLPMTNNIKTIVNFVENVEATGGGDAPECYELVLHEALAFKWTPGWNHVLVIIGDELPHEANANPNKLDWKTECGKLKDAGVVVHGVQALNRKHASKFYAAIANLTGGVHLPLDQFNAITDLVMAVCYREARPAVLERFEKEVQAGGRYNRSIQVMFDRMLGRTPKAGAAPGDMNAVSPGRFQVLDVDSDCSIKDFVLAQGVTFKTGRGFYEFTKPEIIQDGKEIILMDPKNGDMFEGDYARTLINAPKGGPKGVRIAPGELDYIPFIQSTSHNRKLIGGTRFLYEVGDT